MILGRRIKLYFLVVRRIKRRLYFVVGPKDEDAPRKTSDDGRSDDKLRKLPAHEGAAECGLFRP